MWFMKYCLQVYLYILTCIYSSSCLAQERFFVTPFRGADGARVVTQLQQETARGISHQISITAVEDRVDDHASRMTTIEGSVSNIQAQVNAHSTELTSLSQAISGIEPHASGVMPGTCSQSGAKLRWNTTSSNWECVPEGDPTVQDFAKNALPACVSGQLLKSNGSGFQCVTANSEVTLVESDPKVGTVTNAKYCRGTGSQVVCDQEAPVVSEIDPQVGAVTDGRWCRANGGAIQCDQAPPPVGILPANGIRSNFPDVLLCRGSNNDIWALVIHAFTTGTGDGGPLYVHNPALGRGISFDLNGDYLGSYGDSFPDCAGKSLTTLQSEGKAFFFGGHGFAAYGMRPGYPDLLVCEGSNGDKWVLNVHGWTTGTDDGGPIYTHSPVQGRGLTFFENGGYRAATGDSFPDCAGKSLTQLKAEGKAYYYANIGKSSEGILPGTPDGLVCRASNNDLWVLLIHGWTTGTGDGGAIFAHSSVNFARGLTFSASGVVASASGDPFPDCSTYTLTQLMSARRAFAYAIGMGD
jgi:hypothetical protein